MRRNAVALSVLFLSAVVTTYGDVYVIPGYEDGGTLTHWGQSYARELPPEMDGQYPKRLRGKAPWPLYNYYMLDTYCGGSSNGLCLPALSPFSPPVRAQGERVWDPGSLTPAQRALYGIPEDWSSYTRKLWYTQPTWDRKLAPGDDMTLHLGVRFSYNSMPAGCTAVAFSSLFQHLAVTGCVSRSYEVVCPKTEAKYLLCGYDHDTGTPVIRPRNPTHKDTPGTAALHLDTPALHTYLVFIESEDPSIMDDYYEHCRYIQTVPGAYDWSALPSSYGGKGSDSFSYGALDSWYAAADRGDDVYVDMSRAYDDVMTPGARDLIGRVTYNLGVAFSMTYTLSESVADTRLAVERLRSGSSAFPGVGRVGCWSDEWDAVLARQFILAGHPVVASLVNDSEESGGNHCVLLTGVSNDLFRISFGWNGQDDGWFRIPGLISTSKYQFSGVKRFYAVSGYGNSFMPVHGIVSIGGRPAVGVPVSIVTDGVGTNSVVTDANGVYRGLAQVPLVGSGVTEDSGRFSYRICVDGAESQVFSASSYRLGDGEPSRGMGLSSLTRHSTKSSWGSEILRNSVDLDIGGPGYWRDNGYGLGTPIGVGSVLDEAASSGVPVVFAFGTSGVSNLTDNVFLVSGFKDELDGRAVVYFVDRSDTQLGFHDPDGSVIVADPSRFSPARPMSSDNGVLSSGSFASEGDIRRIVLDGLGLFQMGDLD